LQRLAAEIENIRAALAWSIASGLSQSGLRLAVRLFWFWRITGHREGREWLERLLAEALQPSADRVQALLRLAALTGDVGDDDLAIARREQALDAAQVLGDPATIAATANTLAVDFLGRGEAVRAQQLAERSLALCQDRSDMQEDAADAIMLMGELAFSAGDPTRGQALHEQAMAMFQDLGTLEAAAWTLLRLGDQAFIKGDLVRARELHEKSAAMWRSQNDRAVLGVELCNLGFVLIPSG